MICPLSESIELMSQFLKCDIFYVLESRKWNFFFLKKSPFATAQATSALLAVSNCYVTADTPDQWSDFQ